MFDRNKDWAYKRMREIEDRVRRLDTELNREIANLDRLFYRIKGLVEKISWSITDLERLEEFYPDITKDRYYAELLRKLQDFERKAEQFLDALAKVLDVWSPIKRR